MGCTGSKAEDLESPIDAKDLIGIYSVATTKDHVVYVELRADGVAKWRHDARDGDTDVSGDCSGQWEYKAQGGEVWITGLHYAGGSGSRSGGGGGGAKGNGVGVGGVGVSIAFHKVIPALTVLSRASFETVQLMQTRAATSASKRVSIVASNAKDNANKAAVLKAKWKRVTAWPADFGSGTNETSPEHCVGCSTSFKY